MVTMRYNAASFWQLLWARLLHSHIAVDKAFNCFDASKDGNIHPTEMTGILGESFCGKPTQHIFSEMDKNGDRVIDYDEFSSMVSNFSGSTSNPRRTNHWL